ncbi:UNVERIFIED_CONTAM: hypothetical protein NCL1_11590 [Trichonephila clavipes]
MTAPLAKAFSDPDGLAGASDGCKIAGPYKRQAVRQTGSRQRGRYASSSDRPERHPSPDRADRRRAGRGLRRHRHQPALRAQGLLPDGPPGYRPRQCGGHPVADLLVADADHLAQVHRLHHACRQQRRRRHHGAAGAGAARAVPPRLAAPCGGGHRPVRRRAVLRRRHDHPGHLRAVGGGRPADRGAAAAELRHSHHHRDPGRAVHDPAPRHGLGGQAVRPGHAGVVPDAGGAGHTRHPAHADHPRAGEPLLGAALHCRQPGHRLRHAERGGADHHRRRGAVRRHGPLRPQADPPRLVPGGVPGADAELRRPGRAAAVRSGGHRQSVLQPGAGLGAPAAGGARHHGCGDRLAGGDHRRVLDRPPGHAAGLPAALRGSPHLGARDGPDLHALLQLDAAGHDHPAGADLPQLRQPRRHLRHRGDHDHDLRRAAHGGGGAQALGLAPRPGDPVRAALPARRPGLLRRHHAEDHPGRLVPALRRLLGLLHHGHLEARPAHPRRASVSRDHAAEPVHQQHRRRRRPDRAGHGHLHDRLAPVRAARAAAQPQAQQDHPRAQRAADHGDPRRALRG